MAIISLADWAEINNYVQNSFNNLQTAKKSGLKIIRRGGRWYVDDDTISNINLPDYSYACPKCNSIVKYKRKKKYENALKAKAVCVKCSMGTLSINEIGNKYGLLTVISRDETVLSNERPRWICKCECGRTVSRIGSALRWGKNKNRRSSCNKCNFEHYQKQENFNIKKLPDNNGQIREYYRNYIRGARDRGYVFELTLEKFKELVLQECYICGRKPYKRPLEAHFKSCAICLNGIDRVDSAIGYIESNCKPACTECNFAKKRLTHAEFLNLIKLSYEFNKLGAVN